MELLFFLQHFCKILVDFQMSAKAKVTIAAGAVVCNECELKGEVTLSNTIWWDAVHISVLHLKCFQVTIGPRTVVHPKARILAEAGPIFIGEGNLIGVPQKTIITGKIGWNLTQLMQRSSQRSSTEQRKDLQSFQAAPCPLWSLATTMSLKWAIAVGNNTQQLHTSKWETIWKHNTTAMVWHNYYYK